MKYLIFTFALVFGVPVGAMFMRQSKLAGRVLLAFLLLAPAINITINFISNEWYRGDTRGIEFDLTDILSLTMLLGMALSPRFRKIKLAPPGAFPFIIFLSFLLLSIAYAYVPLYGFFTLSRILRGFLLYVVLYNYLRNDPEGIEFALKVLAVAIAWQALNVLKQKYLMGIYRATGTFPHPNTLSIYAEMIVPLLLAAVLHKRQKPQWLFWFAILGGMLCVLSTFSRAGIIILGGAVFMSILFSLWQKQTSRKIMIIVVFCMVGIAGAFKASDSIIERFLNAPKSSEESRNNFNAAAHAMAEEKTFGVGLNNYPHALKNTEYASYINYVEAEAGVCHHIYWLYAGDTGYFGLASFLLLIGSFYFKALRFSLKRRPDIYRAVGLGVLASYSALHLHGFTEWVFRQSAILYLFFTVSAMLIVCIEVSRGRGKNRQPETNSLKVNGTDN